METDKIIHLLKTFDAFEKETQNTDLKHFANWILQKQKQENSNTSQLNRDLGYALNKVNRYSKLFAKQYLEGLAISSLEEFSFLTSIKILINPSKSEVYEHTVTELATGQQMMRRLINLGLVEETEDLQDKRIKRVRLTTDGEKVQNQAFEKIGEECNFKFKDLTDENKKELLEILQYLLENFAKNKTV